jgi:hypothetical protein
LPKLGGRPHARLGQRQPRVKFSSVQLVVHSDEWNYSVCLLSRSTPRTSSNVTWDGFRTQKKVTRYITYNIEVAVSAGHTRGLLGSALLLSMLTEHCSAVPESVQGTHAGHLRQRCQNKQRTTRMQQDLTYCFQPCKK